MDENIITTELQEKHVEPFVSETDFPKGGSRLQTLVSKYKKANIVPTERTSKNPLANVKVKSEVGTRSFDVLTEAEKTKVIERVAGVDYCSAVAMQNFGSAKESLMTKQAEQIISQYSAAEVGETAAPILDLVASMKSNSMTQEIVKTANTVDEKNFGKFSSVFEMMRMKDIRRKMIRALAEHESIEKLIQEVQVELKKQLIGLQKDIAIYEEMCKNSFKQVQEFEYDCIALELMIEEVEARLAELTASGEVDLAKLPELNALKSARDRIYRRFTNLQEIRVELLQSIPQVSVLIYGNEIICEQINEIEDLVIPLWKWQYAIAIGAIKQKTAINIKKAIRGVSSKLATGNAKSLHDNMIAAQDELCEMAVAIEDMLTVQEFIDDMVETVNSKRAEARKKAVEALRVCKEIEARNLDLMTPRTNDE